ncbi:MAG: DapH/DapD/GlmU-related protein [Rhodothermales bacterium]
MTSTIDDSARIGTGLTIGAFSVIERDVVVGNNCRIGHHVILRAGSIIGDDVRIDDGAIIGKLPMRAAASAVTLADTPLPPRIGSHSLIGSHVIIYAGAEIGQSVLVADFASVRERVSVGNFTIVGRGVAIENDCTIGQHCKIETNAYITARSTLADRVFVAPGVLTSNDNYLGRTQERFKHFGGVEVRRGGRLGVGAIILPNRIIEEEAVVGAGAVLTRDAPRETVMTGVPARALRPVSNEQLLED